MKLLKKLFKQYDMKYHLLVIAFYLLIFFSILLSFEVVLREVRIVCGVG